MGGHKRCTIGGLAWLLTVIGAINWGLVGLGWLFGGGDWNVVHMIFGGSMTLEGIIYLLVGIGGVMQLFHCKCKTCMAGEHKM